VASGNFLPTPELYANCYKSNNGSFAKSCLISYSEKSVYFSAPLDVADVISGISIFLIRLLYESINGGVDGLALTGSYSARANLS